MSQLKQCNLRIVKPKTYIVIQASSYFTSVLNCDGKKKKRLDDDKFVSKKKKKNGNYGNTDF